MTLVSWIWDMLLLVVFSFPFQTSQCDLFLINLFGYLRVPVTWGKTERISHTPTLLLLLNLPSSSELAGGYCIAGYLCFMLWILLFGLRLAPWFLVTGHVFDRYALPAENSSAQVPGYLWTSSDGVKSVEFLKSKSVYPQVSVLIWDLWKYFCISSLSVW